MNDSHLIKERSCVCFLLGETGLVSWELHFSEAPAGWAIESHKNHELICVCVCVCACVCVCVCACTRVASVVSDSLWSSGLQPTRLLCPWGFSRQEYWSGLSFPPLGDLPNPGIKLTSLTSPAWQAGSLPLVPAGKHIYTYVSIYSGLPW